MPSRTDRALGTRLRKDQLRAECWCHRTIVIVADQTIRDGGTGSCGHPACHPPEKAKAS